MTEGRARIAEFRPRHFPRYPDYKDSDVEWLGEIPAHWDMKRLKFVSHIVAGQSPPSEAVVDSMDGLSFLQGNAEFGPMNPTPHQVCDSAPKRAEPGDILLSVRAPVGAMNMADRHYGIGRGLCAIRPTAGLGRLFSFYEVMTMRPLLDAVATGSTYDAVTASDVGDLPMLLPGRDEQRAIAAFLERETVKIDALVAKKERLIELLQEKRTALITRAVTRGLDPNVPIKDSGVEWLGEIPAHWNVVPLRLACHSIETGGTPNVDFVDGEGTGRVDWFTPGDFRGNLVLRDSGRKLTQDAISLGKVSLFPAGSVFVVGIGATLGKVGLIEEPASSNQQINILIPRADVDSSFLANVLLGLGDVMTMMANGATLPILNQQQIGAIHIPIPPILEQKKIASAIGKETHRIGRVQLTAKRTIDLLSEYRIALISAAVSGKIDVRMEAA